MLNDRLPLITISIVRTISFTMYTSTKRILNSSPTTSTSSRKGKEREVEAPWVDLKLGMFTGNTAKDVAVTSLLAGGASGAVVCVGSAPFELVKVGLPLLVLLSSSFSQCLIVPSPQKRSMRELMTGPTTTRIPNIPRLAPYPLRETPTIHLGTPSTKHLIIPSSSRNISFYNPSIPHPLPTRSSETTTIRPPNHSPGRQDDHQISRIRWIIYRLEASFC